jgi:hypothetical protein
MHFRGKVEEIATIYFIWKVEAKFGGFYDASSKCCIHKDLKLQSDLLMVFFLKPYNILCSMHKEKF